MAWLLIHLNEVLYWWLIDIIEATVPLVQLGMEG